MKLLSSEDITKLEFPHDSISSSIEALYYKTLDTHTESLGQQGQEKLNRELLFTGNQTMEEREQSYKVSNTMEVHCGFCSGGIFHIEDEDRVYLSSCEAVVTTCNFGGGDDIYQPINMTQASLSKVCYTAFWDEITLEAQAAQGRKPDSSNKIGHWRIVVVKNLPFADQRLNGKIPKLSLRHLSSSENIHPSQICSCACGLMRLPDSLQGISSVFLMS